MESLGLSKKDAQFRNKQRRKIKGQLTNVGSPEKRPLKWSVCVLDVRLSHSKESLGIADVMFSTSLGPFYKRS